MHYNVHFYGFLRIDKLNNKIDMKKINQFQEFKVDIPLDIQINVLEEAMQIQQDYIKDLEDQLTLKDVVGQSEQLLAYTKFLRDELHLNISDTWVESYVKNSK